MPPLKKKNSVRTTTVNLNLTIDKQQFAQLEKLRKEKKLLSVQELIRNFISYGLQSTV